MLIYNYVNSSCKGGISMRKHYLDNIRWVTVVLVVIYHVLYMYNGEGVQGGLGKITEMNVQYCLLYQAFHQDYIWRNIQIRNSSEAEQQSCWFLQRLGCLCSSLFRDISACLSATLLKT